MCSCIEYAQETESSWLMTDINLKTRRHLDDRRRDMDLQPNEHNLFYYIPVQYLLL